jgi:hypothetical protein
MDLVAWMRLENSKGVEGGSQMQGVTISFTKADTQQKWLRIPLVQYLPLRVQVPWVPKDKKEAKIK